MKSRLHISTITFMLFLALQVHAQQDQTTIFNPAELVQRPQGFLQNLIDPGKFHMSQSYSLSMFSAGGQSYNQGLYMNIMTYQFSDPLTMQVRLGYLHQPFGQFGREQYNNSSGGQAFVHGATLQYKPSNNMMITLDYQTYPTGLRSPYGGYGGAHRSLLLGD